MMTMRFEPCDDGTFHIIAEQSGYLCYIPVAVAADVDMAATRARWWIEDETERQHCVPSGLAPRNWPRELPYPFPADCR